MNELPWIAELKRHLGLAEIAGAKHNATLQSWLKDMGKFSKENKAWYSDDETPWCGLAVGHALGVAGRFVVPDWFRAKAWGNDALMTRLQRPAYGCIATKTQKAAAMCSL